MNPRLKKGSAAKYWILAIGLATHLEVLAANASTTGQANSANVNLPQSRLELIDKARASLKHLEPLVAGRVARKMTIYEKNGTQMAVQEVIEHAYRGEKRLGWSQERIAESGEKGFTIEISTNVDTDPSTLLDGYKTWTPSGSTTIDGASLLVFKGTGHESTKAIAYIDPVTEQLRRLDLDIDVPFPGVKAYHVVIDYTAEQGLVWPNRNLTEMQTSFLFRSRRVIMERKIEAWATKADLPFRPKGSGEKNKP